jgi:hypothetical protein
MARLVLLLSLPALRTRSLVALPVLEDFRIRFCGLPLPLLPASAADASKIAAEAIPQPATRMECLCMCILRPAEINETEDG